MEIDTGAFTALSGPIRTNYPNGEAYLRAAAILDPALAKWVEAHGAPDAIQPALEGEQRFLLFYLAPPRSYVFGAGAMISQLNDVPRSVRWVTFEEKNLTGAWPVTIPPTSAAAFDVPKIPPDPPSVFDWNAHEGDAALVKSFVTRVSGAGAAKANRQLERLEPAARTPGINWNIEVFHDERPTALAIPDGSLFVSDSLVGLYSEDELAAAIAHLMGHVRYGHFSLVSLRRSGASVIGLTVLADAFAIPWDAFWIVAALQAGGGGQMLKDILIKPVGPSAFELKKDERTEWQKAVDAREHEIEANFIAEKYLGAAGISPNVLFEALMKQPPGLPAVPPLKFENTNLGEIPYDNGVADLGRMLDAGIFPNRSNIAHDR